jgi:hypothetical protein
MFARALEGLPVLAVVGIGAAGVFVAMNVLVTAAPVAISRSPSPSVSTPPSFAGSPSLLPLASDTTFATPVPTAPLPSTRPTIVNSAVSASDPNGTWSVYLRYPAFVAGTTPWADAIDADILGELQTRAAQWELGPAANRQASGKVNTLIGSFTTELLTPALASFTLTWVDDSSTGTPANGVETLNYDLGSGQRIAFDDLFVDAQAARVVISNQAVPQLQAELGANYEPQVTSEGTSPAPANYVNWNITSAGIKITFAQYQVSSRLPTLPTIVVSWAALKPVMVGTGPVWTLTGF